MNDPWFMSNHLTAVSSMVATSYAHPSVILHAFFNEGPSNDPAACVGYAASSQTIKERMGTPPMRFVTWANNKVAGDVCIVYEDVISFNNYPGTCRHRSGSRGLSFHAPACFCSLAGWYNDPGNVSYPAVYWGQQVRAPTDVARACGSRIACLVRTLGRRSTGWPPTGRTSR